jgi:thiamine pyrophosphokinase
MRSIIFANGEFCQTVNEINITKDDLVIAADGGSCHCQTLEIIPDVLIGDLDSTSKDLIQEWQTAGVLVIRHPAQKDQTDLELALLHAQAEGASEIIVYGAVGGRLDMTFGNLLLLAHPELTSQITLICGGEEVHVLRPGESLVLQGSRGDTVSLFSLQPGESQITTKGLEYPLEKEGLGFGFTRGVSNRMAAESAFIQLEVGLLAVIHTHNYQVEEGKDEEE